MNRKERRAAGEGEAPLQKLQKALDLALSHYDAGRLETAIGLFRTVAAGLSADEAGAKSPENLAAVYYHLGAALQDAGRLDEAKAAYVEALAQRPDFAEAHYNLGTAQQELGALDDAELSYRRAITCRQDFVEAYFNFARLISQREPDAAIGAYSIALKHRPDFSPAVINLSLLLTDRGDYAMAAQVVLSALRRGLQGVRAAFVEAVQYARWTEDDPDLRAFMVEAIEAPWGRPRKLAYSALSLLMLDPAFAACVAAGAKREVIDTAALERVARDPLFNALLRGAPICDAGVERFLTAMRARLLDLAAEAAPSGPFLEFFCALAQQCFINEYVYAVSDEELRKAGALRAQLGAKLESGGEAPVLAVLATASYFPLSSTPFAERLCQRPWPEAVKAVLVQQIDEPAQEAALRQSIPQLTEIDQPTSQRVRDQYEQSPYPRWIKTVRLGAPRTIDEFLREYFPAAAPRKTTGPARILIAGCGTGQQAIETAWEFADTQVTAMDLSLTSLAYARRKSLEVGLTGIDYFQGDLLRLTPGDRPYDMIESMGVLHHTGDLWGGWRTLAGLLADNGLMRIGLYSLPARRRVNAVRAAIAARGWGATPDEIRRVRPILMDMEARGELEIVTGDDFFTLSGCRDLFFHVQEECVTLDEIAVFLRENGLTFLGFDANVILGAYRRQFPNDPACTNLAQLQAFEYENPETFYTLYSFWVQKDRATAKLA